MLVLGSYYMGRTVHHAVTNGYLLLHHLDGNPSQSSFLMMTVGALLYLVLAWASLLSIAGLIAGELEEGTIFDSAGSSKLFLYSR